MNKLKRFLALALVLTMLLPIAACGGDDKGNKPEQSKPEDDQQGQVDIPKVSAQLILSQKEVTLVAGKTFSLVGAYTLKNCTDETVIFGTSDPTVASVSKDGVIRALTPGKATITLAAENGKATDSLEVTVVSKDGSSGSSDIGDSSIVNPPDNPDNLQPDRNAPA